MLFSIIGITSDGQFLIVRPRLFVAGLENSCNTNPCPGCPFVGQFGDMRRSSADFATAASGQRS
jgi:hypothetical protein